MPSPRAPFLALAATVALSPATPAAPFTNPIGPGADPWVIRHQGFYYLCASASGGITVTKAAKLQDIAKAPKVKVWTPPATGMYSKELWAPELHLLDGKWYVYVAADDGENANHRMFVLEGTGQDPQGPFQFKGKIAPPTDRWAIDGTLLEKDGKRYFVWSGWEGTVNVKQDIYIAPMLNPWTLSGDRVRLSTPEYDWEKRGGSPAINEGPQTLARGNDLFIVYSASGSWSDHYCLGQLRLTGADPLKPASWTKSPAPVFSPTDKVFGPGHCSFVKSPDGTEDWIVYHAAVESGAGWNRNIRMQEFTWKADGSPDFGIPVPGGVPLEEPSAGLTSVIRLPGVTEPSRPRGAGVPAAGAPGWLSPEGRTLQGRLAPSGPGRPPGSARRARPGAPARVTGAGRPRFPAFPPRSPPGGGRTPGLP